MTPFLDLSLFAEMTKFKSYFSSYHPIKSLKLERWSGHGEMIDPLKDFYAQKTFYLGG